MFRDPFILGKTKTRLIHAKYSEKVPVTMSANESAVLETLKPQPKKETTLMTARNSEKVPVTTSAKESTVFETILPQQKKRDDHITRSEFGEGTSAKESAVLETYLPQQKKKTTVIYTKNTDASCTQQVNYIKGKKYLLFQ